MVESRLLLTRIRLMVAGDFCQLSVAAEAEAETPSDIFANDGLIAVN